MPNPTGQGLRTNPIALPNDTGVGEVVTFGSEDGSETLSAGKVVYLNSSGVWMYVDADAESTTKGLVGIALGTDVSHGILLRGFFDAETALGGSMTKGAAVYISTTAGGMTQTAPSGASDGVRIIGWGTDTACVIYFNPDNAWVVYSSG